MVYFPFFWNVYSLSNFQINAVQINKTVREDEIFYNKNSFHELLSY